jgi:hypothetical protein
MRVGREGAAQAGQRDGDDERREEAHLTEQPGSLGRGHAIDEGTHRLGRRDLE